MACFHLFREHRLVLFISLHCLCSFRIFFGFCFIICLLRGSDRISCLDLRVTPLNRRRGSIGIDEFFNGCGFVYSVGGFFFRNWRVGFASCFVFAVFGFLMAILVYRNSILFWFFMDLRLMYVSRHVFLMSLIRRW